MTPVIPHGLTLATQEHYLQSYALPIQPRKMPQPNGVNSVPSKVMMMMMMMMMSSINCLSIITTLLMKVMTPFLIFPTMTSMTTCHQISFAKKVNKPILHLKGNKAIPHLKGKVDLMKKQILHLKGMLDLMKKLILHLKVHMDQALVPVDPLTPIQALSFLQMMKQHSALPHSFPRTKLILSNLSL
jgi:hypothetical protein